MGTTPFEHAAKVQLFPDTAKQIANYFPTAGTIALYTTHTPQEDSHTANNTGCYQFQHITQTALFLPNGFTTRQHTAAYIATHTKATANPFVTICSTIAGVYRSAY